MALDRGEVTYASLEDASLIEVQREPGRWEGSSGGISLPLLVLGSVYSGRSSSQYVPGCERPTELDKGGVAYVTSTRVAFAGDKKTHGKAPRNSELADDFRGEMLRATDSHYGTGPFGLPTPLAERDSTQPMKQQSPQPASAV